MGVAEIEALLVVERDAEPQAEEEGDAIELRDETTLFV